jgi:NADH:ubiquinone oxidoreductase subunit 6 (subunit J)
VGVQQINLFFNDLNEHYYPLMASNNWPETFISSYSHIVSIAYSLYTYGIFLFLITSVILLLALITPIYLSERQY